MFRMQIIDEPLSQGETDRLKRWLDDTAFDIFARVIESEAFRCECQAANHVIKNTEAASKAAAADVAEADKNRHVLSLVAKYRGMKSFQLAKAIPSKPAKL